VEAEEPDALPFALDIRSLIQPDAVEDGTEVEVAADEAKVAVDEVEVAADEAKVGVDEAEETAKGSDTATTSPVAAAKEILAATGGGAVVPPGWTPETAARGDTPAPVTHRARAATAARGFRSRGAAYVYDCDSLVELFHELAMGREDHDVVPVIGLVGYPNVIYPGVKTPPPSSSFVVTLSIHFCWSLLLVGVEARKKSATYSKTIVLIQLCCHAIPTGGQKFHHQRSLPTEAGVCLCNSRKN